MPVRDTAVFTVTFTHSFDSIAQAERGGCAKCGPKVCDKVRSPHTHPCTSRVYRYDCLILQFTVIHTCADTHDPEVMAYCSICGCKYDSHPTTARWRVEKEAGERADRARYERMRAAQDAQDPCCLRPLFGAGSLERSGGRPGSTSRQRHGGAGDS